MGQVLRGGIEPAGQGGDRPYPEDLRSIFWAAPHDPDEDFHCARQISSWTLPGLLGTLKEEGLPFPQTGPEWRLVYRALGKVLAARAFLTDTPAEVMQLPVQDVADSKEQMILRAVCDERISVPLESLMQLEEV